MLMNRNRISLTLKKKECRKFGFARLLRRVYLLNWVRLCIKSGLILRPVNHYDTSKETTLRVSDKCGVGRSASLGFLRRLAVFTDRP